MAMIVYFYFGNRRNDDDDDDAYTHRRNGRGGSNKFHKTHRASHSRRWNDAHAIRNVSNRKPESEREREDEREASTGMHLVYVRFSVLSIGQRLMFRSRSLCLRVLACACAWMRSKKVRFNSPLYSMIMVAWWMKPVFFFSRFFVYFLFQFGSSVQLSVYMWIEPIDV